MTTPLPDVTVGIPFYAKSNPAHFLEAIDSILAQSTPPAVIHLIQDGPVPDALLKIAHTIIAKRPGVEHIVIESNLGLPAALNLSISQATTAYYARMDADDISAPDRIERQVRFLEANPSIDILGTFAYEFRDNPSEAGRFLKEMPTTWKGLERFFHYRCPFIHSSVMFRRSVFSRIGRYDERFRTRQDLELWGRALRHRVGMANLDKPLLYFRVGAMIVERGSIASILREAKARYTYNTYSPRLNLLKLMVLLFRFLPIRIQTWGYANLR